MFLFESLRFFSFFKMLIIFLRSLSIVFDAHAVFSG